MKCAPALPPPLPSQALLALRRRASDCGRAQQRRARSRRPAARPRPRRPTGCPPAGRASGAPGPGPRPPTRARAPAGRRRRPAAPARQRAACSARSAQLLVRFGRRRAARAGCTPPPCCARQRLPGGAPPGAPTQVLLLREKLASARARHQTATSRWQLPQAPKVLVFLTWTGMRHLGPHLEGSGHARSLVLDGLQCPRRLPRVLEADTGSAGGSTGHLIAHLRRTPSLLCLRQPDRLCSPRALKV